MSYKILTFEIAKENNKVILLKFECIARVDWYHVN